MGKLFYLNGELVKEDVITNDAELTRVVNKEYYETPEYSRKQSQNAFKFFGEMDDMRDELERRHG